MKLVKKLLAGGLLSTVILANSVLSVGACRCPDNCNYEDIYKSVWLNNGSSTEIYYGEKNNSHSVYFQFCCVTIFSRIVYTFSFVLIVQQKQ